MKRNNRTIFLQLYKLQFCYLFQIQGTRATNSTPNCNEPITCPANDCSAEQVCAYGWQLDAKGCPTCNCLDPCADAKCRSDEICELLSLECEVIRQQNTVKVTPSFHSFSFSIKYNRFLSLLNTALFRSNERHLSLDLKIILHFRANPVYH